MTNANSAATLAAHEAISAQQAYDIGLEAYIYFYPLLTMDTTRRQSTNMAPGKRPGFGPVNTFSHMRAYPDASFKSVVRPNFDTLYSVAWLDLTDGPVIVSVPDTAGRYYLLPMLDMWTDVFASPGWRTTGTEARNYALIPPGWQGKLPDNCKKIDAPTAFVWIIGRIKTDGPDDYSAVHKVQDGLSVTELRHWGTPGEPAPTKLDPSVDMTTPPLETVNKMTAGDYFTRAAELLTDNNPHLSDWSILARLKRVGIEAGKRFEIGRLEQPIRDEFVRGAADALKLIAAKVKTMGRPINGWAVNTDSMGVYGNFYLKRAIVAMVGLGANQPEDAIYPLNFADADGEQLLGEKSYVLHFDREQLPPVDAFWSLTMYDENGFQAANSIDRFAISSWMPLKRNKDESLDIFIQHENPGPERESNWLPAPPKGVLGVTMRLYAPRAGALNGDWVPPAIKKAR
jgi:hypothetical protein